MQRRPRPLCENGAFSDCGTSGVAVFDRILNRMREKARTRQYIMTLHAEEENDADGFTILDVEHCILTECAVAVKRGVRADCRQVLNLWTNIFLRRPCTCSHRWFKLMPQCLALWLYLSSFASNQWRALTRTPFFHLALTISRKTLLNTQIESQSQRVTRRRLPFS